MQGNRHYISAANCANTALRTWARTAPSPSRLFRSHAPHWLPAQPNSHSPARAQRPTSATTLWTSRQSQHTAPSTGTRTSRGALSSALHTPSNLELPTSRLLSSPSSTALCRSWAILFSHPNDFMPVCTTELGSVESLKDEFQRRGVKVAALSCNDVESHGVCQPVELGGWDGGGGPRLGWQLTPWPAVAQRRGSRTLWRSTNAKGPGFTSRLSPTRRGPSRTRWA